MLQTLHEVGHVPAVVLVEDLDRVDRAGGVDSRDGEAVADVGGREPGAPDPVRMVGGRVGVLVDVVPARHDASEELGVREVDAAVEDREHDRLRVERERPSGHGLDVRPRGASGLPGVLVMPLRREEGVVRTAQPTALADVVRLGVGDARQRGVERRDRERILARAQAGAHDAHEGDLAQRLGAARRERGEQRAAIGVGTKPDQDLVGDVARAVGARSHCVVSRCVPVARHGGRLGEHGEGGRAEGEEREDRCERDVGHADSCGGESAKRTGFPPRRRDRSSGVVALRALRRLRAPAVPGPVTPRRAGSRARSRARTPCRSSSGCA